MRYAQIRKMDIANGRGIGVALFVQGCTFHCKNCFNPETWDFEGGKEWTTDIEHKFIMLADKPYITRISILGGEPLATYHYLTIAHLCSRLKTSYPEKEIWIYTGRTLNLENIDVEIKSILPWCDVLVDGRYEDDKRDLTLSYRGSSNQRVIDLQQSLLERKIILYDETSYELNCKKILEVFGEDD